MQQAAEGPPLAAGIDVAKRPDQRGPVVDREQGVLGGVLVDDLGEVGPGNAASGPDTVSAFAAATVLLMALHMGVRKRVVLMLLKARQQSLQGRLDVADRADRDRMPPADMRRDRRRSG